MSTNTQAVQECDRLFESLSAAIDGEASSHEVLAVQAHLSACAHCREVEAALRGLGGAAATVPPLAADFAARTRRLVEERASRTWWSRLQDVARRIDGLFPADRLVPAGVGESPLAALMQTRADRAGARGPSFWLALAAGIYGLPALILGLVGWEHSGAFFLAAVGLGLLAVLPVYHFRTDVSILTSLRRGRCLEEITGTGLPSSGIADSLASFSLRSLLRVGWPVELVMLAGTPLVDAADRPVAVLAALLWLPALALAFAVGSYAVQALVVFARSGDRPTLASAGAFLVMAGPAAGLATLGVPGCLAAAGWVALAGRTLATWGLDHAPLVEHWNRASAPRRNRWVRGWSDNPIVAREVTRWSAAIPFGLLGLFLVRFVPALLPGAAAWGLAETSPSGWSAAFWGGLAALGWIAWLRAANRTSSALAQENEGSTLETMVQSGLTRGDFVSGWLQVACVPLYFEFLVTAALILGVAFTLPEAVSGWATGPAGTLDLGAALLGMAALAAMPLTGAWAGLAVSTSSATRREAGGRAVASVLRSFGLWLATWGVATAALTTASALFSLQFASDVWTSLVLSVLPAAALGLSVLGVSVASRRAVEVHLRARWEGVALPEEEVSSASQRRLRNLVLAPAFLAAFLALVQAGIFLSLLLTTSGPAGPTAWLLASFVAAGAVGLAAWWLLRPLAVATADHCLRSVWGASLLAGVFGGLAGAAAGALPLVVRLVGGAGHPLVRGLELDRQSSVWPAVTAGFVAAALVSALGWLARPPAPAPAVPFLSRLRTASGPAARRTLVAVVGAVAIGLGVLLFLLQQSTAVPLEQPDLARRVLEEATARESARVAVRPDQDGFALLGPMFLHRQRGEVGLSRRASEIIDGFNAFHWANQGDRDTALRVLDEDAQGLRTRESAARFDATLPLLRQALERPEFVTPPRWSEGTGGWQPNFILMRSVAQNLALRALVYEREGRVDEALETHLLNVRWSRRTLGQGILINGMIGIAMVGIADEALLAFLAENRLTAEQYERLLATLAESRLTVEAFRAHVDDEFAFGQRAFDEVVSGEASFDTEVQASLLLPRSYLERERRLYTNEFLRMRRLLQASNRELARFEIDAGVWQDSPISVAAMLLPNMQRAYCQLRLALTRQTALQVIAQVELHRLRTGGYPAEAPRLWSPLDEGPLHYRRTGQGYRLWSASPILKLVGRKGVVEDWVPRSEEQGR